MDDGASPAIGLIVFLGLVIINGMMYGFLTALEEVSEGQVQKRAEAGSKHAAWLLAIMDSPYKVKHAVQILVTFVSGVFGIYQIRLLGDVMFAENCGQASGGMAVPPGRGGTWAAVSGVALCLPCREAVQSGRAAGGD